MDCVPFEPGREKMSAATPSAVRDKVAFLTGITGQVWHRARIENSYYVYVELAIVRLLSSLRY
jgi:hypothetical protein